MKASPDIVAHHTIKYENMAIHKMLPKNDMGKNFFKLGFRVSGNVIAIGKINGNKAMYEIRFEHVSGHERSSG